MKIKEILLENHFMFGNNTILCTNEEDEPLKTIILAGENGSGKTTILKTIFEIILNPGNEFPDSKVILEFENEDEIQFFRKNLLCHVENNEPFNLNKAVKEPFEPYTFKMSEKDLPSIIYIPSEITFPKMEFKDDNFKRKPFLGVILGENIVRDIPSFLATKFRKEIFKNKSVTAGESIDRVCKEINMIFETLEVDIKITGLSEEDNMLPLFKNKYNHDVDINSLSSGEKQLFIRALSLKMLEIDNSIILIDEPEVSLHPKWQQKIVRVYESMGENNQIIIATHSPHIISSVKAESLKILIKGENGIEVIEGNTIGGSYGYPAEKVLIEIMGLETTRYPDMEKQINELKNLVKNDKYDTDEFRDKYDSVADIIGTIDKDMVLINMSVARRKGEKNAKNR